MNITAVARKARVSTATVSRTMNGTANVSPKTAARVRRAIEALNFYPNVNARALGSGRSSLYGLIISDITNPFFPELVKAFEDIAVEHGKEVLIANTNYDAARMEHCVTRMLQRKVDGVAIMTSEMDDRMIDGFSRRQIPLVFLDTGAAGPGVSSVRIDYHAGVATAVHHLRDLGHRRIAFLSGPLRLASARVRQEAFLTTMRERGLLQEPAMIEEGNHRVDGGHAAMVRILDTGARPTAVVASNDLTAIGALGAMHERGLRVPEDVSLVGFDDIQISAFTQPALTTLGMARTEIAETAFRSLFQARGPEGGALGVGEDHVIHPRLVLRQSTSAVRSSL